VQALGATAPIVVTLPAPAANLTFSFNIQGLSKLSAVPSPPNSAVLPVIVNTSGGLIVGMSRHGLSGSNVYLSTATVSAPICTATSVSTWSPPGAPSYTYLPVTCETNAIMTLICDGTNWNVVESAVNFGDESLTLGLSFACSNFNAPRRVIYIGYNDLAPPNTIDQQILAAVNYGFNVVILAFIYPHLNTTPPPDPYSAAFYWAALTQAQQQTCMGFVHARGAVVLVAGGGASFAGSDYVAGGGGAFGANCANWAVANNLDGVDLDFENISGPNFQAGSLTTAQTVQYFVDASAAVKSASANLIVTHAPQSPYFGPGADTAFNVPGYSNLTGGVLAGAGTNIDWCNVQFYNQGPNSSETYQLQMINSGNAHPNQAIAQLKSNGNVPYNKIVMGKNLLPGDGSAATYNTPQELGTWTQLALTKNASGVPGIGWHTGVSFWQWTNAYGQAGIRGAWPS
jgi:chitinase